MKVKLNILEEAVITIFNEMREQGVDNIDLDSDFYWNVPSESIYDAYNEPAQLDIGQLEDDYAILYEATEKSLLVRHNLKNIAAILRYLAEKHSI